MIFKGLFEALKDLWVRFREARTQQQTLKRVRAELKRLQQEIKARQDVS